MEVDDNSNSHVSYILLIVGWVFNWAQTLDLTTTYDFVFKGLSLLSIALVAYINIGKIIYLRKKNKK